MMLPKKPNSILHVKDESKRLGKFESFIDTREVQIKKIRVYELILQKVRLSTKITQLGKEIYYYYVRDVISLKIIRDLHL